MPSVTQIPLIPAQIRAGRALLDWNQQKLADAAKLSLSSVRDYESERRGGVVGGLGAIRRALENEGVVFLSGDTNEGPGVRLTGRIPSVLRRPTKLSDHDALIVPIVWHGQTFELFVHREVLEDLGSVSGDREPTDSEYVELFDQHRAAILAAAARAIDAKQVAPDRRVHLAPPLR